MTELLTEEDLAPATADTALEAAAAAAAGEEEGPPLPLPTDGPVTLPGGYRRIVPGSSPPKFEVLRKAWVKELDGYAEERISKARLKEDFAEFLLAILESGVEKIGDWEPDGVGLREMLSGDREFLLLQISVATYGDEIDFTNYLCPACGDTLDVTITKDEIPIVRLAEGEEPHFTYTTKNGKKTFTVNYPTVNDQAYAFEGGTGAESNSLLLARIVDELHGDPDEARALSMRDRQGILDELGQRLPGPRYNGVTFKHWDEETQTGCGTEVGLTVSLAALFPGLELP